MNAQADLPPARHGNPGCATDGRPTAAASTGMALSAVSADRVPTFPSPGILMTRWRQEASRTIDRAGDPNTTLLSIAVTATDVAIKIDDVTVHDGRMAAGTFHVVAPGQCLSATFRKPADFIRLHVPRRIHLALVASPPFHSQEAPSAARPVHDRVIEQLALSVVSATCGDQFADRQFLDGIGVALLARTVTVLAARDGRCTRWQGLIPWRLQRVVDFIDAHLDAPLSLSDLAQAAGLSRMHFAAQFRQATGFRPHVFLTRRRIERAQDLLRHTKMPLVDVALSVGFQTQAHFTTIFRQFAGTPPGQWRRREALDANRRALVAS